MPSQRRKRLKLRLPLRNRTLVGPVKRSRLKQPISSTHLKVSPRLLTRVKR